MSSPSGRSNSGSLVVVSNRLPFDIPKAGSPRVPKRNVGGLVNALEPVLARRGGTWIGWGGSLLPSAGAVNSAVARPQRYRTPSGVELVGMPLGDREIGRYYHGISNRALWPLFHSFPGKAVFEPEDFPSYRTVNRRMAELALRVVAADGRVWVHDFHLMLVPGYLRHLGFRGTIDFFLHIPFPAQEIFRAAPWRDELMRGLLSANRVGFHVAHYRDNFVGTAAQLAGGHPGRSAGGIVPVEHARGRTEAFACPIGVEMGEFEETAALAEVKARARRLREAHRGCRILLGVDRLDYTKGIRERMLIVERYLEEHPQEVGRVVMLQIVVPSRNQVEEYRVMKREIEGEVGRINGRFARDDWVPIHYRYLALDRKDLVAHYISADAALVTPLRDGLNLVAMEYAASRHDNDGVLLLSEFAGFAEHARGAVLVNPYDVEGTSRILGRALSMEPPERRTRMSDLRRAVGAHPLSSWAERCLGEAPRGRASGAPVRTAGIAPEA